MFTLMLAALAIATGTTQQRGREVPSRFIPLPSAASSELQNLDSFQINTMREYVPKTMQEWEKIINLQKMMTQGRMITESRKLFPGNVQEGTLGGVRIYRITPDSMPKENEEKVLINVHGGGYILMGGEGALPEALAMSHYGKFKVIAVDYRMPPDYPFPAGLDDIVTVYKELLKNYKPQNIGIFGTSAGGSLTAATVLKIRQLNLPMPAVVSLGTPWSDLTKTGDTYFTNEEIDNILVSYNGLMESAARLYAGPYDLKDPLLSPIYADYTKGFPPAILTSGTRDLFLSNTVRLFRKLRQAGIEAELQVFEGAPHAFYLLAFDAPESKEAFQEIVRFFNKHFSSH